MTSMIDQNTRMLLTSLYEKFVQNLRLSNKKLIRKSALLTLIKLTSNDTYKIAINSSDKFDNIFRSEITTLERMGLICHPDDKEKLDEMVITAKGIWYIENSNKIIELDDILEYLQSTKFEFSSAKQELIDTEKIILCSMIAVRVFSQDITMNLNTQEYCDKWQEIIEDITIPFLQKNNLIKLVSVIDKKTGNEHPISYLMRHANNLPKKTNNLFSPTKRNQYYLALSIDNSDKCASQLAYLLKRIFPSLNSQELVDDLYEYFIGAAHNHSLFVTTSFEFITPSWDRLIKECLEDIYFGIEIL